jgi:hypothetical protein
LSNEASDRLSQQQRAGRGTRRVRIELLNAGWHRFSNVGGSRRCAACLEPLRIDEHVVRRVGDVFHPFCALYEVRTPVGGRPQGL